MMLLQRLVEYGGRWDSSIPPRYDAQPVKYLVVLREDGTFIPPVQELSDGEVSGKRNRGRRLVIPYIQRSGTGSIPNLLVDNAEYALGIARSQEARSERRDAANVAAARHASFVALVRECFESTGEPSVGAVLRFLENGSLSATAIPDDFDATARVGLAVRIGGEEIWPWDLPSAQRYWRERGGRRETGHWQCLVCGEAKPAVKTVATKIRGVPNTQGAGAALVSFDKPAFRSYGLEQTENAPICEACAEGSHKALNSLIEGATTHVRAGLVQYVFWTRDPLTGFDVGALLERPDTSMVQELYHAAQRARARATALDESPFYATALSGSSGRVVVRDWLETTAGRAKEHLSRYFRLQELVEWDGSPSRPLAVRALTNATLRIRPDRTEVPAPNQEAAPAVAPALLHLALEGGRLPESLLYAAVRRGRAEQRVLRGRAVLIKMTLRSWEQGGEDWMVQLDATREEPGYLCGRLLAVIEAIQRAALGNVNATVVDRFYGTASAAPMAVFSYLLKGAQPHLGKLRRERPGTYRALDQRLQEVLEHLKTFPAVLSLEQQGLFALGYYHQRAADRQGAIQARAMREQTGTAASSEQDSVDVA